MRKFLVVLGLVALVLCPACLTDKMSNVSPSDVHAAYTVHFDESDRTLIGEVQFTTQRTAEGASIADTVYLELDNESTLTFDGQPMIQSRNLFNQITYRRILSAVSPAQFEAMHYFRYQPSTGDAQQTSARPQPAPTMTLGNALSKRGFTVRWNTSSAIGFDTMQLMWHDKDVYPGWSLKESALYASDATSGELQITAEDLASWQTGSRVYMQLCRLKKDRRSRATGGLSKHYVSCTKRQPVSLVP